MSPTTFTTFATPTSTVRRIIIIPYPFNSPIAHNLIMALDAELGDMYQDWDQLPHPGDLQNQASGENMATNMVPDMSTDNNENNSTVEGRMRAEQVWEEREIPMLNALDANDTVNPNSDSNDTFNSQPSEPSTLIPGLTTSQVATLHFHIAFDITNIDINTNTNTNVDTDTDTDTVANKGKPIACIGLKLMPYYPSHRPFLLQTRTRTRTETGTTKKNNLTPAPLSQIRTAELKRIYIAPEYRGIRLLPITTSTSTSTNNDDSNSHPPTPSNQPPHRLPELLLSTATTYARDTLGVKKLVLETGYRQVAAVRVYERCGWRRMEGGEEYGDYVGCGVGDGGVSVCFEMGL